MITFRCDKFDDEELYVVERYCKIVEKGPAESFFSTHDIVAEAEPAGDDGTVDDVDIAQQAAVDEVTQRIESLRVGGEIELDAGY